VGSQAAVDATTTSHCRFSASAATGGLQVAQRQPHRHFPRRQDQLAVIGPHLGRIRKYAMYEADDRRGADREHKKHPRRPLAVRRASSSAAGAGVGIECTVNDSADAWSAWAADDLNQT
jgi:hypothetical protein